MTLTSQRTTPPFIYTFTVIRVAPSALSGDGPYAVAVIADGDTHVCSRVAGWSEQTPLHVGDEVYPLSTPDPHGAVYSITPPQEVSS